MLALHATAMAEPTALELCVGLLMAGIISLLMYLMHLIIVHFIDKRD
jgi:hypothetical protein